MKLLNRSLSNCEWYSMRYKAYRKVLRNFFVTSFGNDARRTLTTDRARKRVREVTAGRNNAHLNEDRKDLRQLSAGLKSLELLRQSAAANERKVFSNLTHLLSHDDVLLATYIALRKKGNASMTVGVTRPLSFNIDDLIVLIRKKQLQFRHKPPPRQKALLRIGELYRMNPLSRLPTAEDTILEVSDQSLKKFDASPSPGYSASYMGSDRPLNSLYGRRSWEQYSMHSSSPNTTIICMATARLEHVTQLCSPFDSRGTKYWRLFTCPISPIMPYPTRNARLMSS